MLVWVRGAVLFVFLRVLSTLYQRSEAANTAYPLGFSRYLSVSIA